MPVFRRVWRWAVNRAGIVLPPGGFFDAVDTRVAYRTVLLSHIMTTTPDAVPGLRYHADWT